MTTRFDYVLYDDSAATRQAILKKSVCDLDRLLSDLPDGRAKSLAVTKLEECYMWIGKAIRDDQVERTGESVEVPQRGEPSIGGVALSDLRITTAFHWKFWRPIIVAYGKSHRFGWYARLVKRRP